MKQRSKRHDVQRRVQRRARSRARTKRAGPSASKPSTELAPRGFANDNALTHGVTSQRRWAELAPMLHAERINILDAKGHTETDADPVKVRIVDAFNQSVVMMNTYFEFLSSTGGPISVKGRTRRAVEGWSRAADRVAKFATMLGLERRARRVNQSPVEWLESLPEKGVEDADSPERRRRDRPD
jgi:hypothetical protein